MDRDVVRGSNGFSYEPKATEDSGIVEVRDARDDYFARAEYVPELDKYFVEIDAGYSTKEDLQSTRLFDSLEIGTELVPEVDSTFVRPDELSVEREMVSGSVEMKGVELEVEEIQDDERKTLVRITSPEPGITSIFQFIANEISEDPPAISSESDDQYARTWAPYSDSSIIRSRNGSREETIEDVFETALNLSRDILEPRKET